MGIFTWFNLIKKRENVKSFPYEKAIQVYNEALNDSNYYSNEYYSALNGLEEAQYINDDESIKRYTRLVNHYKKELEKVSKRIDELESAFHWLPTEINRHL
ncbi:BAR domain-containing protein [Clostridium perfringens]|uniref:hypothetical protein n=1 Tax=Clostridium perfringens TaxID=1502 RepID=UPI000D8678EE|nr:hypothetical protein [Clostridium perfringens]MDK0668859.1 hypothetical protein [Clostridium perfringens]MDM0868517.1 hypothetical protein [Clostridium perfringens]NGU53612.1 hypothetical protein [Clostridium perfringens]PWX27527.1 hypothetical protein CYK95_07315 [Clostridium perfringens]HAT4183695.1 hypothetical protein [Clostridium perfringens]